MSSSEMIFTAFTPVREFLAEYASTANLVNSIVTGKESGQRYLSTTIEGTLGTKKFYFEFFSANVPKVVATDILKQLKAIMPLMIKLQMRCEVSDADVANDLPAGMSMRTTLDGTVHITNSSSLPNGMSFNSTSSDDDEEDYEDYDEEDWDDDEEDEECWEEDDDEEVSLPSGMSFVAKNIPNGMSFTPTPAPQPATPSLPNGMSIGASRPQSNSRTLAEFIAEMSEFLKNNKL
jgi:hypothetical protein